MLKNFWSMDIKSAKLGALCLVIILAIWHTVFHFMNGNYEFNDFSLRSVWNLQSIFDDSDELHGRVDKCK